MNTCKFGVPGSLIASYIEDASVPCTSEGEAMAMAAGAWLVGVPATVYMQNSGLGDCIDAITSLYRPYGIPLPSLILGIRSSPEHHRAMGVITQPILDLFGWIPTLAIRETP